MKARSRRSSVTESIFSSMLPETSPTTRRVRSPARTISMPGLLSFASAGRPKTSVSARPASAFTPVRCWSAISAAAAKIADQHRTGVNADAGRAETDVFGLPALAKLKSPGIEIVRAGDRTRRVVGLVSGSIEENMDSVTDDLRDRAFMREHDLGHSTHIFVKQGTQQFGDDG